MLSIFSIIQIPVLTMHGKDADTAGGKELIPLENLEDEVVRRLKLRQQGRDQPSPEGQKRKVLTERELAMIQTGIRFRLAGFGPDDKYLGTEGLHQDWQHFNVIERSVLLAPDQWRDAYQSWKQACATASEDVDPEPFFHSLAERFAKEGGHLKEIGYKVFREIWKRGGIVFVERLMKDGRFLPIASNCSLYAVPYTTQNTRVLKDRRRKKKGPFGLHPFFPNLDLRDIHSNKLKQLDLISKRPEMITGWRSTVMKSLDETKLAELGFEPDPKDVCELREEGFGSVVKYLQYLMALERGRKSVTFNIGTVNLRGHIGMTNEVSRAHSPWVEQLGSRVNYLDEISVDDELEKQMWMSWMAYWQTLNRAIMHYETRVLPRRGYDLSMLRQVAARFLQQIDDQIHTGRHLHW